MIKSEIDVKPCHVENKGLQKHPQLGSQRRLPKTKNKTYFSHIHMPNIFWYIVLDDFKILFCFHYPFPFHVCKPSRYEMKLNSKTF